MDFSVPQRFGRCIEVPRVHPFFEWNLEFARRATSNVHPVRGALVRDLDSSGCIVSACHGLTWLRQDYAVLSEDPSFVPPQMSGSWGEFEHTHDTEAWQKRLDSGNLFVTGDEAYAEEFDDVYRF